MELNLCKKRPFLNKTEGAGLVPRQKMGELGKNLILVFLSHVIKPAA